MRPYKYDIKQVLKTTKRMRNQGYDYSEVAAKFNMETSYLLRLLKRHNGLVERKIQEV